MPGQNSNSFPSEVQHPDRRQSVVVSLLLTLAVFIVFGQTLGHEFVNYDDEAFVYGNPAINHGFSLHGVVWLFTHYDGPSEWLPLTAISHMLDCDLYGPNAGGHHLTNVLLHAVTVVLLFQVLRKMTGLRRDDPHQSPNASAPQTSQIANATSTATAPQAGAMWRSAFVAAVFAIHPLRVESVAWVTERKDVLSGLFFMLTLWAYVCHAGDEGARSREPGAGSRSVFSFFGSPWYWLALVLFTLGLLSKTMLVTLPFVLLLLDYWPLERLRTTDYGLRTFRSIPSFVTRHSSLFLEKVPFLVLSGAACVATVLIQKQAVLTGVTFPWRVGNALVAYAAYLGQLLYPAGLAVLYPHPGNHLSLWKVGLSLLILLIIPAGVLAGTRKHPYLLVGWLWYLGMLVPVIGLIQVGNQARADRYTYLPQIGLYILVAWGAAELCSTWRFRRAVLGCMAGVILTGLMAGAYIQTGYWKDSVSLWTRTLACTSQNPVAQFSFGGALAAQGKWDEAVRRYEQALQLKPDYADAHIGLGSALVMQGKVDEAIQHYERALQLKPDYVEIHLNLGFALARQGKWDEAIQQYQRVLQLKPDFAEAHINLAETLANQGKLDEAIQHYERALQLQPDYADGHNNLGIALARQGKLSEAVQHFERALELKPTFAEAHNNLGIALADQGRLNDAIQHFELGLILATAQGNAALAQSIRARLRAYPQAVLPP